MVAQFRKNRESIVFPKYNIRFVVLVQMAKLTVIQWFYRTQIFRKQKKIRLTQM
jgi:hypothetical protein